MFANARQALGGNGRRPGKENGRQNGKPLRSSANIAGASSSSLSSATTSQAEGGGSTFLRELGQAEQKFSFFYDTELEVRKPDKKFGLQANQNRNNRQEGRACKPELFQDKENKLYDVSITVRPPRDLGTGAIPKTKNRTGLAVRPPGQSLQPNPSNVPPAKPARKEKQTFREDIKSEPIVDENNVAIIVDESPKKATCSAENTPADYLISEPERGSSTCGISSQMKGIELSSAGGPLKKLVQVPFGELDISGKRKSLSRRPSSSSSQSSQGRDSIGSSSEDDKENDALAAAKLLAQEEEVSPPTYSQDSVGESVDGLPTNCFAIPRPSVDKARVSLHKLQEDEMCRMREYVDDIFAYLREEEKLFRPRPMYMSHQPDLAPHMRCMLVDWLVEVAMEYKLSEACLFMAVSYIDRFLSFNKIYRSKLQLLGTTAMFIAAKVEEIYPPESEEFVFITDNTYTKEQLLKMETFILMALDFRMTCVTPHTFFSKFVLDCDLPESVSNLAQYLLELAMMEGGEILNYLPSVQAAAGLALAAHTLMIGHNWKSDFLQSTQYRFSELTPCMTTMKIIWTKAPTHDQQAVRQKYLEPRMKMVANTPVSLTLPRDAADQ